MEKINLTKISYSKEQYKKVIDNKFSQLATSIPSSTLTENNLEPITTVDVSLFFQSYNQIFFNIPKFGDTNSHEYLIKKSSEYIGSAAMSKEFQALIDEINSLQLQNLELNQKLVDLQISSSKQI